jgi:plastocyanin
MKLRTTCAAAAAVALLAGLAACGDDKKDSASSGSATTTTTGTAGVSSEMITMKNLAFTPTDITVKPGEQVMVMNADSARHNLQDKGSGGKKFNTGDLEAGKGGVITAPTDPGDYPYLCKYHFGMEGTLHVK